MWLVQAYHAKLVQHLGDPSLLQAGQLYLVSARSSLGDLEGARRTIEATKAASQEPMKSLYTKVVLVTSEGRELSLQGISSEAMVLEHACNQRWCGHFVEDLLPIIWMPARQAGCMLDVVMLIFMMVVQAGMILNFNLHLAGLMPSHCRSDCVRSSLLEAAMQSTPSEACPTGRY